MLALLSGIVGGLAVVVLPNPLIGFILVAGLLMGGLMLARPRFTLSVAILITCLLPFGVIPVQVGLTFTLLEATLIILFVGWLLQLGSQSLREGEKLVSSPFDWSIFLLSGLSFFALILGLQTASTTDIHNYVKLILAILAFFPVINLVRTQAAIDKLLRTIMLAGSLAGYIGVGLYLLSRDLQEQLLVSLGRIGYPTDGRILRFILDDPATQPQRATGTSVDPNSFGGMLVLIIALLLTQLFSSKPLFRRWLLVLMLFGPSASLLLTYGRGAQLGALGVAALIATVKYRRLWLYALPFLAVGAAILPSTFLWSNLIAGLTMQDQSTILRLSEYQNALDIVGRYPWFGIGFGKAPDPDLQEGVSMIYLNIAERMGLVGLLAFGLVMVLFFLYVSANFARLSDEKQKANLLGLTGGIVGALSVGILDHYFFNIEFSHMAALFWLFMALTVAQIHLNQPTFKTLQQP
jgi:O-antigen ligase